MKTFYIMISKAFMKGHPRAGEPTFFKEKIQNAHGHRNKDDRGLIYLAKNHTIRDNYEYWARIANEVNAGRGILSLRQWTKSPYNFQRDGSKQKEFLQLSKMRVQRVSIIPYETHLTIHLPEVKKYGAIPRLRNIRTPEKDLLFARTVCQNDGLNDYDFKFWFDGPVTNGAIIHFTDFRYE